MKIFTRLVAKGVKISQPVQAGQNFILKEEISRQVSGGIPKQRSSVFQR